ncbi:NAD-dependent epimerase/dehydratase family protein [Streptomyces sp. cmx-4-9]|uniref:NAD-dependent epimerase/dehydratase family protein n=1 Tax=Streptomyces sp. cmx-4-9 TaxID=2790941 RepID=UPI00397F047E
MPYNVLITGSQGFIGSHVVREALAWPDLHLRLMRRPGGPPQPPTDRIHTVVADLTDPDSLRGVCEGVDAVLHCASAVGGDEDALRAVNDLGTRHLLADARRHGVRRVVHVGTASVHGRGPFRQAEVHELPLRPASPTSASRAAAEAHVLEAGGAVLRPHLVYGTGDRWVVPGLAGLLRYLGTAVDTPSVHSAVEAGALASAVVAAAMTDRDPAGVHHAGHPVPLGGAALMDLVHRELDLPVRELLDPAAARARVDGVPQALHHLDMLLVDHWFEGAALWELLDLDPGPSPLTGLPAHLPWYRELLHSR